MPAFVWLVVVAALTFCSRANAVTITSSYLSASNVASLTVTYNTSTSTVNWAYTVKKVEGVGATGVYGACWVYKTSGDGGDYGVQIFDVTGGGLPPGGGEASDSGTFSLTSGSWLRIGVRSQALGSNAVLEDANATRYFNTSASESQNKVRVRGTNTQGQKIRIMVLGATSEAVLGDFVVENGAAYDNTYVLEDPDTSAIVRVFVQGEFSDGIWSEIDDINDSTTPVDELPPIDGIETPEDEEPDMDEIDLPDLPSPGPSPSQTTIWRQSTANTVDNERLDKATFKQGVDKLLDQLKKTAPGGGGGSTDMTATNAKLDSINTKLTDIKDKLTEADVPDTGQVEAQGDMPAATPMPAPSGAIVPVAPAFFSGEFGSDHVIEATLPTFSVAGRTWPAATYSLDFEDYAAPIAMVRGVLSAMIVVAYFILCVRAARGSSAND